MAEFKRTLEVTDDPREDLIRICDQLTSRILDKNTLRLDRLAAAEALTHPEIGRAFFNTGQSKVIERISGPANPNLGRSTDSENPKKSS